MIVIDKKKYLNYVWNIIALWCDLNSIIRRLYVIWLLFVCSYVEYDLFIMWQSWIVQWYEIILCYSYKKLLYLLLWKSTI